MPEPGVRMVRQSPPAEVRPALVVFEHREARGPLRLLAPGFRHCFCLLRESAGWLLCDPLTGGLVLRLLPDYPLAALCRHFLATKRHIAVGFASTEPSIRTTWLTPCTCVELVKRALSLRAAFALTPRQLFEFLKSREGWTVEHAKSLDWATVKDYFP
jgi:hypothetical protein